MSLPRMNDNPDDGMIDRIKEMSGRRIEDERRRQRLTQRQFAQKAGISVRWLREIEGGNPIVKLDDHLRCATALCMAPTYMFLPLLYRSYGRSCPINVAVTDLVDLDQRYIALINRRISVHIKSK